MDSRLYACSISLVGGVFDDGTWCGVVGRRGCGEKMRMRCDKACEILADMSARFVQF